MIKHLIINGIRGKITSAKKQTSDKKTNSRSNVMFRPFCKIYFLRKLIFKLKLSIIFISDIKNAQNIH